MTESIVILSEKGLEQSISPSGPSKKRETDRKTHPEMERERREERSMRANRDRMRESIELVPVTSAPVGTTIKLPLDRPRTIQYMFTQCIIFKGTNKYVCVCSCE